MSENCDSTGDPRVPGHRGRRSSAPRYRSSRGCPSRCRNCPRDARDRPMPPARGGA